MPRENFQIVARYPRPQAPMGEYPRCVQGGFNSPYTRGRFYTCPSSSSPGQPGTAATSLRVPTNSEYLSRPLFVVAYNFELFFSLFLAEQQGCSLYQSARASCHRCTPKSPANPPGHRRSPELQPLSAPRRVREQPGCLQREDRGGVRILRGLPPVLRRGAPAG